MRDKQLYHLLLGLNGALAFAFVIYLVLSSHQHPRVSTAGFPIPQPSDLSQGGESASNLKSPDPTASAAETNPPAALPETVETSTNSLPAVTNPPPLRPTLPGRTYGWHDIETDTYQTYLDNLQAAGCPPDKIRYIILADIDELISQKRLKEATAHDPQWWRAEPELNVASLLREKGLTLEEERRQLVRKWLGEEAAEAEQSEVNYWSNVQLTGPVLGALPQKDHTVVQEICGESMDRYQTIFWSAINAGQPINQLELAKLRQRTRTELTKVLSPEEQEEFLLRYSHNANRLRQELRGFNPTAEEFRKIFRAIDPIDHTMQLEYGSAESLSPQQRERYEKRRAAAIEAVLSAPRYEAYLLTKDPLYRQAQMMALQYGAPSSAIGTIYQMAKQNESRRKQILQDTTLTADQKRQAINAVYLQQQQSVRKIVSEANLQPQR